MGGRVGVEEFGKLGWNGGEFEKHGGEEGPYTTYNEADADEDEDGTGTSCKPIGSTFDAAKGFVYNVGDGSHGCDGANR